MVDEVNQAVANGVDAQAVVGLEVAGLLAERFGDVAANARQGVQLGQQGVQLVEVDRVEVGYWRGEESVTKGDRVQLPDEYAGHVMIFRTFDKVSYGLVMQSTKPSRVGYRLKGPDAK